MGRTLRLPSPSEGIKTGRVRALEVIAPEKEHHFQTALVDLARLLGWRVYHPWSSLHSAAGWPDLFLVRGNRAIAAELKRSAGMRPRPIQQAWLDELALVPGIQTFCWTPADWSDIVATLQGGVPSGSTGIARGSARGGRGRRIYRAR
jgi:hypothetical protein